MVRIREIEGKNALVISTATESLGIVTGSMREVRKFRKFLKIMSITAQMSKLQIRYKSVADIRVRDLSLMPQQGQSRTRKDHRHPDPVPP